MDVTSVTSKGQVTIPKELRQQLGIRHAQESARRCADRLRPCEFGQARARAMIGLDANVLARHYIDDAADAEAKRQRLAARRLIETGQPAAPARAGTHHGRRPGCRRAGALQRRGGHRLR